MTSYVVEGCVHVWRCGGESSSGEGPACINHQTGLRTASLLGIRATSLRHDYSLRNHMYYSKRHFIAMQGENCQDLANKGHLTDVMIEGGLKSHHDVVDASVKF